MSCLNVLFEMMAVAQIPQSFAAAILSENVSLAVSPTYIERFNNVSSPQGADLREADIIIGDLPCEYGYTAENATLFDSTEDCVDCMPDGNITYWKELNGGDTTFILTKNFSVSTDTSSAIGRALYYDGMCANLVPYKNAIPVQIFYLTPVATQFANTSWISVTIRQYGYRGPFLISGSLLNGSANIYLTEVADDNLSCIASVQAIMQMDESRPSAEMISFEDFDDGVIPDLRDISTRLFISFTKGESPPYCTPLEGAHNECDTSPCGVSVHCTDLSTHTLGDFICTCQHPETGTPTIGTAPECSSSDDSSKMMFLFVVAITFAVALVFLGGFLYYQTTRIKEQERQKKKADEKVGDLMSMQATQGKELSLLATRDRAMKEQYDKSEIQKVNLNAALSDVKNDIRSMPSGIEEKRQLESNLESLMADIRAVEMSATKSNKQLDELHEKLLL